jgi:hypothetical protein
MNRGLGWGDVHLMPIIFWMNWGNSRHRSVLILWRRLFFQWDIHIIKHGRAHLLYDGLVRFRLFLRSPIAPDVSPRRYRLRTGQSSFQIASITRPGQEHSSLSVENGMPFRGNNWQRMLFPLNITPSKYQDIMQRYNWRYEEGLEKRVCDA